MFNAYFAVSQAWKSWAVHQIALYCYEFPGLRVTRLSDFPFAVWDEWRRSTPGARGLDAVRRQFGRMEIVVAIAVSAAFVGAGLFYGSLPEAGWAALAVPVQCWMFVYVIKAPLRSEEIWKRSIRRRKTLEGRKRRYGPLPKLVREKPGAPAQETQSL